MNAGNTVSVDMTQPHQCNTEPTLHSAYIHTYDVHMQVQLGRRATNQRGGTLCIATLHTFAKTPLSISPWVTYTSTALGRSPPKAMIALMASRLHTRQLVTHQ